MSEAVIIAMLKDGQAFVDIANATGVSISAISQRVSRLQPKLLTTLLSRRLSEQKTLARIRDDRSPVDVAQELLAIQGTLQSALDLTGHIKNPGARVDRMVRTATVQLKWIDSLMDTHREMYKLAGVRAWQEAIVETMRESGPEVLNRFLDHLQRKGHLSMVAVESSGFANKATVEPSAAAVEPAPRPTVPDEGIDVEEDEEDEG